ncbi:MAG: GH92 family glycosyl hydrolase [Tissierellia bacterium]|nr:GH92 family glycosyl hydrolase [Tissierellia bacterium]
MKDLISKLLGNEKFADSRIGSKSTYEFSNGNTLPLTGVPHGQNYFSVQTSSQKGAWWFDPEETNFEGFRLTHQPSPWMGDFSYMTILPYSGSYRVDYIPEKSVFKPCVNRIEYADDTNTILTASKYGAIISYEGLDKINFSIKARGLSIQDHPFHEGRPTYLGRVINYAGSEDKDFAMYFVIETDKKSKLQKIEKDHFVISVDDKKADLRIITSFISQDQALYNFSRMTKSQKQMLEDGIDLWEKYLNKIEVDLSRDGSDFDKYESYDRREKIKFFYHALYRSFLFPMTFYEIDEAGREIHYDTKSKTVKPGKMFTNIGFWDGQKTLFPLLALIARNDYEAILEGILNFYKDTGFLPKWLSPDERGLMPGVLVDNVIADAAIKNIGDNLVEELFEAMLTTASKESDDSKYGRKAVKEYDKYGYVPADFHESVNQTLDNSLSDFSIYVVANKLGKKDLADKYLRKSKNYRNLFDKQTKLLRAKDREGKFTDPFDPLDWGSPYTEGSSYQNSYNMYHDFEGLIGLFGSRKALIDRLDSLANDPSEYKLGAYGSVIHEMREYKALNFGHIGISNQPSFHLPYLYYYVDQVFKTQIIVKELLLNFFRYTYEGYPGDEDNGSMSAWYIFSSLGFYPICPGKNEYIIGIPLWTRAKIHLFNGKILEIHTDENYHHKKFVDSIYIDGKEYMDRKISYEKLISSDVISYKLGIVPKV